MISKGNSDSNNKYDDTDTGPVRSRIITKQKITHARRGKGAEGRKGGKK